MHYIYIYIFIQTYTNLYTRIYRYIYRYRYICIYTQEAQEVTGHGMRWEEEKEEEDEDTGPGQRPGTKEDSHTTSHAHTNTEHNFPARGIHKGLTPPTSDIHTLLYMPGAVTMPRGLPHACAFTEPAHILFHHLRNGLSFTGAYLFIQAQTCMHTYMHTHECTRTHVHASIH